MTNTADTSTIPYASPMPRSASRVWAGVFIAFAGLCLIVLGGCFLIGVLLLVHPQLAFNGTSPAPATVGGFALMAVLYLLAFCCFAGAVAVLIAGLKTLFAIVR
ncbi:MAG: hypothetical protein JWP03_4396 [Phycisphaerales bacterium]|nr:hypothetical protein [Phycisphaerales bacterium]